MKRHFISTLIALASVVATVGTIVALQTPNGPGGPAVGDALGTQASSTSETLPSTDVGEGVLVNTLCPRPPTLPPAAGEIDETDPALGPVYVSGDSALALTNLAGLAIHADEIVWGRIAAVAPGRTTDWYGFADYTVDVEASFKGNAGKTTIFERAVCDRQTGRPVIVDGQLDDLQQGEEVLVFLLTWDGSTDQATAAHLLGGIGIFRVQDNVVAATSRDDAAVQDVEGRTLDDIRQVIDALG